MTLLLHTCHYLRGEPCSACALIRVERDEQIRRENDVLEFVAASVKTGRWQSKDAAQIDPSVRALIADAVAFARMQERKSPATEPDALWPETNRFSLIDLE